MGVGATVGDKNKGKAKAHIDIEKRETFLHLNKKEEIEP